MFVFRVAWRYLTANRVQTGLLIAGVSLGVVVFVFITALIQGLAAFLIAETTGSIAHVKIEPPVRVARVFTPPPKDGVVTAAQPVSTFQRALIRNWQQIVALIESQPGVIGVSPEISGNAFIVRGEATAPISVSALKPEKISVITPIADKIITGDRALTVDGLLIGVKLAENLGLSVGQPVLLRSDRGVERLFTVRGIFETGIGSVDERVAYMPLQSARPLFDILDSVNRIDVKLADPDTAPQVADFLKANAPVKATTWQDENRQLQDALAGQGRTGNLIQLFSMISIIIGVASALLLSTYRRRGEIGIMRSFGLTRRFIATVFVLQGAMIGIIGGAVGCLAGYGLCSWLATILNDKGEQLLPVVPALGGYDLAMTFTVIGAIVAALLPARAAARIDPLEAIQQ
jgi:lipoprotein-releasing system permease protein